VTSSFERTIVDLHGQRGQAWLDGLPALIADCAARWGLRMRPPFPNLSYNYAAPAERLDGRPVVLKLGVPSNGELQSEIAALRLYDGRGSVRLLEADPGAGALLLERLQPGTMLSTVTDDEAATRIAATVMRKLWQPAPAEHNFPSVAKWASGLQRLRTMFGGGTGPLPAPLVDLAENLFAELLASADAPVLLHGDLHHYNILAAEREPWLALDPKGLVGEPAYEVGAFLHNPFDVLAGPDPARKLARRLEVLAEELDIDRQRLTRYGVAVAVLSAWWSVEDQGATNEGVLRCAELMSAWL
jgi:streptomycin 6-kinase